MNRGFAGTVAVPAWARFMKKATEGSTPDWFEMPSDVEHISICRKSGLRASDECRLVSEDGRPNVYDDYYLMGTGPYEKCIGSHTDPPDEPMTAPSAVF